MAKRRLLGKGGIVGGFVFGVVFFVVRVGRAKRLTKAAGRSVGREGSFL